MPAELLPVGFMSSTILPPVNPPRTVLIVEDEAAIAANIEYAFRTDGFAVVHVILGVEALACLARDDIAAVVLDVGLPDINGFELCKRIRLQSQVPVLFVTARGDEVDRVVGLEIGADDYVVKPFSPRELVARVKTILRRVQPVARPAVDTAQAADAAWFVVDSARARVRFMAVDLELTRVEYLLLLCLLAEPERVFTRDQLLVDIAAAPASMARTVDTHIKTLRAKLREVAPHVDPIRTHRGLGYSLQTHS